MTADKCGLLDVIFSRSYIGLKDGETLSPGYDAYLDSEVKYSTICSGFLSIYESGV